MGKHSTIDQEELRSFVKDHIPRRRCCLYIRDEKTRTDACHCGKRKAWHQERKISIGSSDKQVWNVKECTTSIATDAYGTIEFEMVCQKNAHMAPYVTVKDTTSEKVMKQMLKLIENHWNIPPPSIIISVIGGTRAFYLSPKLTENFKRGLGNIATSTDAWIITDGLNEGVSKFIGETVKDFMLTQDEEKQIVVFGIGGWDSVANKKTLLNPQGCFPAKYNIKDSPSTSEYESLLDPNHTHFILVDNAYKFDSGDELEFRTKFEQYVSHNAVKDKTIPLVSLVLEGGEIAARQFCSAVESGTHVLVAKNSGRVADLIAKAYENSEKKSNGGIKVSTDFDNVLERHALNTLSVYRKKNHLESSIKRRLSEIKSIVVNPKLRKMITIFSMETHDIQSEIGKSVLDVLIKANQSDVRTLLNLALAWNLCDIARDKIITKSIFEKLERDEIQVMCYELLFSALVDDKPEFVLFFIDQGVKLKDFLSDTRLSALYKNNAMAKGLSTELQEYILQKQHLSQAAEIKASQLKCTCYEDTENPATKLFLWAVLFNRRQLAHLFWIMSKDPIGGALTASTILKSMAEKSRKDLSLGADIHEHAVEFENRALDVLDACYSKNKELTHQLLTRKLPTWGGSSLYSLAYSGEHMKFLAHSACQTKLNRIWRGYIKPDTPALLILLYSFLPFLLFLPCVKFESTMLRVTFSNCQISPKEQSKDILNDTGKPKENENDTPRQNKCKDVLIKLCAFYSTPIVKFGFHTLSTVIFLGLFSYFVMVHLKSTEEKHWQSWIEFYLWAWVITYFCDEIRQITDQKSDNKLISYFSSKWNIFDQCINVLFVVSIILRSSLGTKHFVYARFFYNLTLLCCYVRFVQAFFVSKDIGPKVIMIKRMVVDLFSFLSILAVFLLLYGVLVQAFGNPNAKADWTLLKNIVYMPYWQMYGELFLEEFNEQKQSTLLTILLGIYMLITNVLLLNLLIAMFSYTFGVVHENAETVWSYYRYSLIYEFVDRPALAPPLIILCHIASIVLRLFKKCMTCTMASDVFETELSHEKETRLTAFERLGVEQHQINHKAQGEQNKAQERMENILITLQKSNNDFDQHNTLKRLRFEPIEDKPKPDNPDVKEEFIGRIRRIPERIDSDKASKKNEKADKRARGSGSGDEDQSGPMRRVLKDEDQSVPARRVLRHEEDRSVPVRRVLGKTSYGRTRGSDISDEDQSAPARRVLKHEDHSVRPTRVLRHEEDRSVPFRRVLDKTSHGRRRGSDSSDDSLVPAKRVLGVKGSYGRRRFSSPSSESDHKSDAPARKVLDGTKGISSKRAKPRAKQKKKFDLNSDIDEEPLAEPTRRVLTGRKGITSRSIDEEDG